MVDGADSTLVVSVQIGIVGCGMEVGVVVLVGSIEFVVLDIPRMCVGLGSLGIG